MMDVDIYTDGSCAKNPSAGGWAALLAMESDTNVIISGRSFVTTANRMELLAVIKGLEEYVKRYSWDCNKVTVYSDSSYVINVINKKWLKNWRINGYKTYNDKDVKNSALLERLYNVLKVLEETKNNIIFTKVKAHSNDPYNDIVDDRARSETIIAKMELKKM